jgi:uncharacterized damage-inducible protein DinB
MTRAPEDLSKLFAYGRWATDRTLESVQALDAEELARPIGGSFGSVQSTLAHLYGADWVWLERWNGRSPAALPAAQEAPDLATLRAKWVPVLDAHRAFVSSLAPARLDEPLTYVNFAGKTWTYPLGEVLVHVANHGTYHRGQIATLLRQLGKAPVSTDYLRYLDHVASAPLRDLRP